jgi:hypothetical protein
MFSKSAGSNMGDAWRLWLSPYVIDLCQRTASRITLAIHWWYTERRGDPCALCNGGMAMDKKVRSRKESMNSTHTLCPLAMYLGTCVCVWCAKHCCFDTGINMRLM